jgi:glutathione S-transferase
MISLYTTTLSANGRKPLAVSHHLGLEPRVHLINVYRGEGRAAAYLALNPQGKVPTLVDGDLVLWESNAIIQYLAEAYGDHALWSRDPKRRADLNRWLFWESSHWQPTLTQILRPVVAQRLALGDTGGAPATADWSVPAFQELARLLDVQLLVRPYLGGEHLTLADFSIAGMMTYARIASFPFDAYTGIAAWFERIEALPAWQATQDPLWVP